MCERNDVARDVAICFEASSLVPVANGEVSLVVESSDVDHVGRLGASAPVDLEASGEEACKIDGGSTCVEGSEAHGARYAVCELAQVD